ncbi:MAG: ribosome silencing factor [Sedimentisphaerales bacterium]|nr:ribosome silencing factor [Sedimentisphaerales bacterium]
MAKRGSDKTKQFALKAAKLADERHCTDIIILDLRGKSPVTDYFIIATGTSDRQMRTIADEINDAAKKTEIQLFGRAGYDQARWILLDYVDVIVHIFDSQYRDYYDLELLWGDAEKIKWEKTT